MGVLDRGVLWGPAAPEVSALECEWASYTGTSHCLAANSGTAALHMAVAAVGVQPGDEVITTPLSWTSTATCVLHHNAVPIFSDIDPATCNIDPRRIEERITRRTRAIVPVHLYGLPAEMDEIMAIAARHGLAVIEDACQATAARYRGRSVGAIGHAGAFSFNGNKNLPGGEGGALVTGSPDVWQEAARVQQFGEKRRSDGEREYDSYGMGWMYRTTEMTAAFIRSQLRRIDATTERIRANAHALTRRLKGVPGIVTPPEPDDRVHVFFRYAVRFAPQAVGLDLEPEQVGSVTDTIRRALVAEGVALGRAEFLIPGMTLFREKNGYGKGCPWTCCYGEPIEYRAEDYPAAQEVIDTVIPLRGLTPPNDEALMGQYADAFEKVFGQLERLVSFTARAASGAR
jgi:dTDP-4-amino-4,6-dideoxygalactose transaminase